ncbi:MAG: helix-turn-helix domain-containing protein [Planctomycetota bacterium]
MSKPCTMEAPELATSASATSALQQILATVEELSGLEASVYSPGPSRESPVVETLPIQYRRHMSPFCRAVKNARDGKGCRGHDSYTTTLRAGREDGPFVQVCRAGVAEVIVPVFCGREHLATLCLGQAVTEAVAEAGFDGVWDRVRANGVDRRALQEGYRQLPRMPERRLLRIGQLLDAAIRGLAQRMSEAAFVREMRLQHAPAVRRALDLLAAERCYGISEKAMAARVHLSVSHFSRLFGQVMEQSFSDYLLDLRIREAQKLLHHTRTPIGDIARRSGFSRQSYFSRRFKAVTGMTPSRYRHQRAADAGSPADPPADGCG